MGSAAEGKLSVQTDFVIRLALQIDGSYGRMPYFVIIHGNGYLCTVFVHFSV